jgi:hypothetical protein
VDVTDTGRQRFSDQVRSRARRWAEPADQWRAKVQRWVDAGIVSSSQGDEILAMETSEPIGGATQAEAIRPTLSPIIEALSYVGVVVVGLASALFLGHYWDRVGVAGHLSVALMVTVAGLLGGYVVAQIGDAGARRLSGFLRLVGTAGAAMTTAVGVGPSTDHRHGLALLCVGLVLLVLSASLWRNLDRSLQFLSTVLGLVLTVSAVGEVAHLHATSTEVALAVWLFALAVALMSLQMLRPAVTALLVGELGTLVGAFALSFPNHLAGVLVGLLSALCAVAVGFVLERPVIIVVGAMGFFMFDFRVFTIYLRSMDAALGAFILGLVLVLVALLRAWYSTNAERRAATPPLEVRVDADWYEPW